VREIGTDASDHPLENVRRESHASRWRPKRSRLLPDGAWPAAVHSSVDASSIDPAIGDANLRS